MWMKSGYMFLKNLLVKRKCSWPFSHLKTDKWCYGKSLKDDLLCQEDFIKATTNETESLWKVSKTWEFVLLFSKSYL